MQAPSNGGRVTGDSHSQDAVGLTASDAAAWHALAQLAMHGSLPYFDAAQVSASSEFACAALAARASQQHQQQQRRQHPSSCENSNDSAAAAAHLPTRPPVSSTGEQQLDAEARARQDSQLVLAMIQQINARRYELSVLDMQLHELTANYAHQLNGGGGSATSAAAAAAAAAGHAAVAAAAGVSQVAPVAAVEEARARAETSKRVVSELEALPLQQIKRLQTQAVNVKKSRLLANIAHGKSSPAADAAAVEDLSCNAARQAPATAAESVESQQQQEELAAEGRLEQPLPEALFMQQAETGQPPASATAAAAAAAAAAALLASYQQQVALLQQQQAPRHESLARSGVESAAAAAAWQQQQQLQLQLQMHLQAHRAAALQQQQQHQQLHSCDSLAAQYLTQASPPAAGFECLRVAHSKRLKLAVATAASESASASPSSESLSSSSESLQSSEFSPSTGGSSSGGLSTAQAVTPAGGSAATAAAAAAAATVECLAALSSKQQQFIKSHFAAQQRLAFQCHVCHSGFEDRHRLQQHLSIHLQLSKQWYSESTVRETMSLYELKRGDYFCAKCQRRFDTTAEFDKHMQMHGDKPHRCELCFHENSFRYYRQYLTHYRNHCVIYKCKFVDNCSHQCNRRDYLKSHILKHHLNNKLPAAAASASAVEQQQQPTQQTQLQQQCSAASLSMRL